MSDIFDQICGLHVSKKPVCKVAYTLNNSQPVACTIIGTQPLFYMDHEDDFEDEIGGMDAAELHILAGELETLKKEIEVFDRFSVNFDSDEINVSNIFAENKNFTIDTTQNSIEDLTATLNQSRILKSYLEFAAQHDVEIKYSAQTNTACYERDRKAIFINPLLSRQDQILLAARELRRHWQHRQGALIHPLFFDPDNAVLVNRIQTADLSVSMIRAAWELQLSGEKSVWERIEFSALADLGRAFAREAFLDFRTINNGQASTAVFEAWFLSERCRHADKELIKTMLADYRGYTFDMTIDRKDSPLPALIAALGEMPFGKNYLANHAFTIMEDAIFTDMRDRSNANFLWFIKFERSFRETEQHLQSGVGTPAASDRLTATQQKDQDARHASRTSAELIQLFPRSTQSQDKSSGDKSGSGGILLQPGTSAKRSSTAEIIDLRSRF